MAEVDSRVTIIPVEQAALAAVTTRYVAFEHPYEDRPGRYVRQADALDIRDEAHFWAIGDVWPAGSIRPYKRQSFMAFIRGFVSDRSICTRHVWPETALYRTTVLQHCNLDPRMIYRPAAGAWSRFYEMTAKIATRGVVLMTEPIIVVPDRLVPEHTAIIPTIPACDRELDVSIVIAVDGFSPSVVASLRSLAAQTGPATREVIMAFCRPGRVPSDALDHDRLITLNIPGTRAQALNAAIQRARGEHIVIWDLSCASPVHRLARQLAAKADLVGGNLIIDKPTSADNILPYSHTNFSGRSWFEPGTMMVRRSCFEQLGGFDEALPVRHEAEFQLRALGDKSLSFAKLATPLAVRIPGETCSEEASYGLYCNLVMRDIMMYFFRRDGTHAWVDTSEVAP